MISLKMLKNKELFLRPEEKSSEMLKSSVFILTIIILVSCAHKSKKEKRDNWQVPKNEYPEIFQVYESDGLAIYKMEIDPTSIRFGCTKRSDYPHYWCDFEVNLGHNLDKYPRKLSAIYMSSRPKSLVNIHKKFVRKIMKGNQKTFLSITLPSIQVTRENEFLSVIFGIETETECINWFNDFDNCSPAKSQIEI